MRELFSTEEEQNLFIMKGIVIVFILISLVYSKICKLNEQELTELEKSFDEAEIYTRKEASNENAAICIGTTRAGKSTLINYLMGNELKGVRFSQYGEIKIIKADNRSMGPEIGAGPKSKTKFPTKWISKRLHNLSIFDSPGLRDNRGPVQEITNSFYLYQLMKNVNSLKFILVIDFADLERENIIPLMNLLLDVDKFFGNKFKYFFQSISVIFSKVPYEVYDTEVDIEMVKHLLKTKASLLEKIFSKNVKDFFSYIMKNNERIALFKKSVKTGIISDDIELNIFSSINNSKSVHRSVLQNIAPSISDNSLLCLYHSKDKWVSMSEINETEYSLLRTLDEMFSVRYSLNNKSAIIQILSIKTNLSIIKNLLNNAIRNNFGIYKNIETLKKIGIKMRNKIGESKYLQKVKILKYVSDSLYSNESEHLRLSNKRLMLFMIALIKKKEEVVEKFLQNLKNNANRRKDNNNSFRKKFGKYLPYMYTYFPK